MTWVQSRGCYEEVVGMIHREQRELGPVDDRVPAETSTDCGDVRDEISLKNFAGGKLISCL